MAATKQKEVAEVVANRELTEHEELVAWRTIRLLDDGFSYPQAIQIGVDRADIVHAAEELLATGKTHEQVAWLLEDVEAGVRVR